MDKTTIQGWILAVLALAASAADAQLVREQSVESSEGAELVVPLYKSRILTSDVPVERISVGNPGVADILILRDREVYVLGKDLGTTNVLLWDAGDRLIDTISVEVTHDLDGLKQKLFEVLPDEQIEVRAAQRSIVLSGSVSSAGRMDAALRIARGYLGGGGVPVETREGTEGVQGRGGDQAGDAGEDRIAEVINLMQVSGAQQVMLEVKVAEIARTELRRLDTQFNAIDVGSENWNFGGVNGGASFPDALFEPNDVRVPVFGEDAPYGPVIDEFAPNPMNIQDSGLFASLLTGNGMLNLAVDAAREKGLAKILAEPTLTTMSGQEAQFLSGGEFPIPVPQGVNGVTIEFKEFGVGLNFVPAVLGSGQINLKLDISVSELTETSNVSIQSQETTSTFLVPSLSKRSASATVELLDGQTIGIAGLINEDLREVVNKFPGLGSIPVLGNLFRSQDFQKGESELVILVTPRLAKPLPQDQIRLPTDDFVEPGLWEFYLLGRLEGRGSRDDGGRGAAPGAAGASASGAALGADEGGVESSFGHEIQ